MRAAQAGPAAVGAARGNAAQQERLPRVPGRQRLGTAGSHIIPPCALSHHAPSARAYCTFSALLCSSAPFPCTLDCIHAPSPLHLSCTLHHSHASSPCTVPCTACRRPRRGCSWRSGCGFPRATSSSRASSRARRPQQQDERVPPWPGLGARLLLGRDHAAAAAAAPLLGAKPLQSPCHRAGCTTPTEPAATCGEVHALCRQPTLCPSADKARREADRPEGEGLDAAAGGWPVQGVRGEAAGGGRDARHDRRGGGTPPPARRR